MRCSRKLQWLEAVQHVGVIYRDWKKVMNFKQQNLLRGAVRDIRITWHYNSYGANTYALTTRMPLCKNFSELGFFVSPIIIFSLQFITNCFVCINKFHVIEIKFVSGVKSSCKAPYIPLIGQSGWKPQDEYSIANRYCEVLSGNECTVTQTSHCAKSLKLISVTEILQRSGGEPFSKLGIHLCPSTHLHTHTQSRTKRQKFSQVWYGRQSEQFLPTNLTLFLSATRWCIAFRAIKWWSKRQPCKSKQALQT